MRIALLHPTYWPEVRRGSERLIHDLGASLARRGHDVTLLTTHPQRRCLTREDGILVDRAFRLPQRGPLRWYERHITAAPPALARLLAGHFDVAHTFFPVDGWAALWARRLGGPPVVSSGHGIIDREFLVKRRYRMEMMLALANRADVVSVLSSAAAAPYERYLGRSPEVLPGGVVMSDFKVDVVRDTTPTLVCAASLGDPRKRGSLLFEAFRILQTKVPNARLLLVRVPDPVMSAPVENLPAGAEWVSGDKTSDLARIYARSWASVLPSVDEAFGLVLVESLAAGTPVVAARSGACPEIVPEDGPAGVLFEPDNAPDMARAMEHALGLGSNAAVVDASRRLAGRWDWDQSVADLYERTYEAIRA